MYVQYCLKVSWQSLALRLNSWFVKLFEDGVSRLDDWGSSFKFRVEKYYELVLYNYSTFYSKNYLSVHWVRPVCFRVNEAHALKAKRHRGTVYDICRLQTADRRLQTADRRLQTADCRPQIADCRLQTTDCRLQTADHRLQIVN